MFNFCFSIEDQRDWQRKPGCNKNPFSCFFCHLLSIFGITKILDLNYGIGSFYEKCSNNLVITGVDIRKWGWLVNPHRFIQADMIDALGMVNEKFNAVIMDPPYNTIPSSKNRESGRDYLYYGHVPFPKVLRTIRIVRERSIANYVILKYIPASVDEEIELLKLARHRIMWRFVRYTIPANDGNKIVHNYSEIFIISAPFPSLGLGNPPH